MSKQKEVKFWLYDNLIEELQFLGVIAQAAELFSPFVGEDGMARVAEWFHAKYAKAKP